jgi:hypothetical protein
VENEVKWSILGKIGYKTLDSFFELIFVNEFSISKVIALVRRVRWLNCVGKQGDRYLSIVRDVSVSIIPSLLNDEMSLLADLFAVFPSHQAPTEFSE